MEVVGDRAAIPDVQREVQAVVDRALGRPFLIASLERFAFYDAGKRAFAVLQCGDPRPYGCFLIRKGVVAGAKP
jgi:L-fucose mutarotase